MNNLDIEIIKTFEKVKQTCGKNKINVISNFYNKNENKKYINKVFNFVYDKNKTTGISRAKEKKINEFVMVNYDKYAGECKLSNLIDYILQHNTCKNQDIIEIGKMIIKLNKNTNEIDYNFFRRFVVRDFQNGISAKTLNKAIPDCVTIFEPMKLTKYSSELLPEENIVMPKLDGNYVCIVPFKDKVKYIARSGKEYKGLNHLDKYFVGLSDSIYFGEIIDPNNHEEHTTAFQKSNGVLNSKGDKTSLGIALFDMYDKKNSKEKYYMRYDRLNINYDCCILRELKENENAMVTVIPIIAKDIKEYELFDIFHQYKNNGYEGLVIYNQNNIWQPKRVKDILKLKGNYSCDLKVLDVFEHKNGNKLGGIIVEYKGNTLKVGSGFNDNDREYFWKNKNEIIGKIAEVEYFTISKNKEGIESLRHPVFKRIRKDKEDESYD